MFFRKQKQSQHSQFKTLMKTAESISRLNPRGLTDLIHAILRPLQSEYLLGVAEKGQNAYPTISWDNFYGKNIFNACFENGYFRAPNIAGQRAIKLQLGKHLVLPCASNTSRYISAITSIGSEKTVLKENRFYSQSSTWRQDSNHGVTLWLPWGVGFVTGGNHSITAGILAAEGTIAPDGIYDMRFLLDEFHTDGLYWYNTASGKRVEDVDDHRKAAVFEIGRLMIKTGTPAFG